MSRYRISVRIRLQGPVLSQATGGRDIGLDAAALRDVHGTPLLPGNLIRGNLRHAWHRLREIAEAHGGAPASLDPDSWLGAESKSDSNDAPIRARLCFSPYWRAEQPADGGVRHRIAVDPQTGAVSNMALQVVDTPFLPGDEPSFVGTVEADLEDQGAADELAERIRQGLEFAGNLGALKGVGFGRVLAVDVESAACRAGIAQSAQIRGCDRIGISLTLDRPFCIAGRTARTTSSSPKISSPAACSAVPWPGGCSKATTALNRPPPRTPSCASTSSTWPSAMHCR